MVDSRNLEAARRSFLILVLGVSLAACRGTGEEVEEVPQPGPGETVGDTGGQPPSADLAIEAQLEQFIQEPSRVGGRQTVRFDLRNASAKPLSFAYTVECLDRSGEPIYDPDARWTPLALAANASASLEIVAPSPRAESWRLRAAAPRQD